MYLSSFYTIYLVLHTVSNLGLGRHILLEPESTQKSHLRRFSWLRYCRSHEGKSDVN